MTDGKIVEKVIEENRKKEVCEKAPATDATPINLAKDIADGKLSCRCVPKEKMEAVNAELTTLGKKTCPTEETGESKDKIEPSEKTAPKKCIMVWVRDEEPEVTAPKKVE